MAHSNDGWITAVVARAVDAGYPYSIEHYDGPCPACTASARHTRHVKVTVTGRGKAVRCLACGNAARQGVLA